MQSEMARDRLGPDVAVEATRTIFFVCVNYNGTPFVKLWLGSVLAQQGHASNVRTVCVVVDSASAPDDYEALLSVCTDASRVQLIRSEKNVGYFGGLNIGLAAISTGDNDFVVVGNNDLVFSADFCARLVATKYRSDVLVVCPDVVTSDGVHQNPHVLRRTNWLRRLKFDVYFSHYLVGVVARWIARRSPIRARRGMAPGQTGEISMGVGACYILLPAFFTRWKTLYFPWFLFGEEACLAWQVREADGVTWYDPTLVVDHAEGASSSKLPNRIAYQHGREAYWRYRSLL